MSNNTKKKKSIRLYQWQVELIQELKEPLNCKTDTQVIERGLEVLATLKNIDKKKEAS